MAGLPADGEVWLQTFPRLFGYAFNPVSFWYCHDSHGQLIAVLADVNNTFGEHHAYLLANRMAAPSSTAARLAAASCCMYPLLPGGRPLPFPAGRKSDRMLMRIDYHDADGLLLNTSISGACSR
jgi:DUF1365 family protein